MLRKEGSCNITKLNLSNNKNLSERTGIYLGDALIENTDHPIKKLNFKKICLQEDGLLRIIEASNKNQHITNLNLGIVTCSGLLQMARSLQNNKSLAKLKFTESEEHPWSKQCKAEFVNMIKNHKNLIKVKFDSA